MNKSLDQCIYCPNPTGSGEHIVLAALGGLRVDRGILCEDCNNEFSKVIDTALAADLRPLCAHVGVHGRRNQPIETSVQDSATGRTYTYGDAGRLQHPEAVVLHDRLDASGERNIEVVASTARQRDEFIRKLRAEGKPLKVTLTDDIPLLITQTPFAPVKFGETDTYRAVARSALNVLARFYPAQAREHWLDPIKEFIRKGGPHEPWVHFEYTDDQDYRVPPKSFPIQHRFLVGFDASTGVVYAKVSFFGVLDLCVRFGQTTVTKSSTVIYDMDVLAQRQPDDVQVWVDKESALSPPGMPVLNPSRFFSNRFGAFLRICRSLAWEKEESDLVQSLNDIRNAPEPDRHELIVAVLGGQRQRLLFLAVEAISNHQRYFAETFGEDGREVGEALARLVEADASSQTGVSGRTLEMVEALRSAMAEVLLAIINERTVDGIEIRGLLEESPGLAIAGRCLIDEVVRLGPRLTMSTVESGHNGGAHS